MRQITEDAVEAFYEGRAFHLDNTEVFLQMQDDQEWWVMALHGNYIARRATDGFTIQIRDCDYNTVTTRERLGGVLDRLGMGIYNHKKEPYLWFRKTHHSIEFKSGYDWTTVREDPLAVQLAREAS